MRELRIQVRHVTGELLELPPDQMQPVTLSNAKVPARADSSSAQRNDRRRLVWSLAYIQALVIGLAALSPTTWDGSALGRIVSLLYGAGIFDVAILLYLLAFAVVTLCVGLAKRIFRR
jgi:hypothetical protein